MKTSARLLNSPALPAELSLALRSAPNAPSSLDLQALSGRLSQALGVTLAAARPLPVRAVEAPANAGLPVASSGAALGGVKIGAVNPLAQVGAWVVGGVALGVGLSGLVGHYADPPGSPAPPMHETRLATPSAKAAIVHEPTTPSEPITKPEDLLMEPQASLPKPVRAPSVVEGAPAPEAEPELSLLRRARVAATSAPEQALALCTTHSLRFPRGVLGQEREVIAIEALLRLGRIVEARARAERFRAAYPGSAHVRRLDALVAQ